MSLFKRLRALFEQKTKATAVANIVLSYKCHRLNFYSGISSEDLIEAYGLAIAVAKKLSGGYILLDDGTMVRGHQDDLDVREVQIDVDDVFPALTRLANLSIRSGKLGVSDIHFHFKEGGGLKYITEVIPPNILRVS